MSNLYSASSLNITKNLTGALLQKRDSDENASGPRGHLKYHKTFNRILKWFCREINHLHFCISVDANSLWASSWTLMSLLPVSELVIGDGDWLRDFPSETCFLPAVKAPWLTCFQSSRKTHLFWHSAPEVGRGAVVDSGFKRRAVPVSSVCCGVSTARAAAMLAGVMPFWEGELELSLYNVCTREGSTASLAPRW